MYTYMLFYLLPILFWIYAIERITMRKQWKYYHFKSLIAHYPYILWTILRTKKVTKKRLMIIFTEEFLLLVGAIIFFFSYSPFPLLILIWGFIFRLLVNIIQACLLRSYVPGLITSLFTFPYYIIWANNLIDDFSVIVNMSTAVCGIIFIMLNQYFLYYHKTLLENGYAKK